MRQKREKQRPLSPQWPDHQLAQELKVISRILDDNPQTLERIVQDLSQGRFRSRRPRFDGRAGAALCRRQTAASVQLSQAGFSSGGFAKLSEVLSLALWGVDQQSHPGKPGEAAGYVEGDQRIWCAGPSRRVWKKANGFGRCHGGPDEYPLSARQ